MRLAFSSKRSSLLRMASVPGGCLELTDRSVVLGTLPLSI